MMNRWGVFSNGLKEKNAFGWSCVQFEESKVHLHGGVAQAIGSTNGL